MTKIMKNDLIYTFRLMKARPGLTFLTLAVLLIGIFVTLSTYSFLNIIAFKSLPIPNQATLVVGDSMVDNQRVKNGLGAMEAGDIRDSEGIFDSISFFTPDTVSLSFNKESKGLAGLHVDSRFFDVVGIKPAKGRPIYNSDTKVGASRVAVISHELWESTFMGSEDVIGDLVRINGEETEIVGVMPKGFAFPSAYEIWVPLVLDYANIRRGDQRRLTMIAHLSEGITAHEADKRVSLIFHRLSEQYPDLYEGDRDIFLDSLIAYENGLNDMSAFRMMMIAVFGILGLACANAGGLLLARMGERQQEIAIRMAMGAKRTRIIIQMMLESLVLTTIAGLLSLLLVDWYLEFINNLFANIGEPIPFWYTFDLNLETLLSAVVIIFITTTLSALYPAIKASGLNFNEVLKSGTRGAQSHHSNKLMKTLVSFEIVVASALVISSSIIVITNDKLSKVDFGIDTEFVVYAQYKLPDDLLGSDNRGARNEFQNTVKKALLSESGIEHVSFANSIPSQEPWPKVFHDIGEVHGHWTDYRRAYFVITDESYFDALNIRLLAGRLTTKQDDHSEVNKVLVTESFAEQWWPNRSAVGMRFGSGIPSDEDKLDLEVIGVVSHVILSEVGSPNMNLGTVFANHNSANSVIEQVLIKVKGDPYAFQDTLKEVFFAVNPDVAFTKMDSLKGSIEKENKQLVIMNSFFAAFGLGALILSMTGIYAIMSLLINQKTQEVGIRRALGATNRKVFWWLVREGWTPMIVGLVIGVSISAYFCYLLMTYTELFSGIGSLVPVVFMAGVLFYVTVVAFAIWVPSRKAIGNEPIYALKTE